MFATYQKENMHTIGTIRFYRHKTQNCVTFAFSEKLSITRLGIIFVFCDNYKQHVYIVGNLIENTFVLLVICLIIN